MTHSPLSPWANSENSISPLEHQVVQREPLVQSKLEFLPCENVKKVRCCLFLKHHQSHACSFKTISTKCIQSFSLLRCYVSMYASIWCNHECILFVLVSFPTKEFGNLALMTATLVESPFEATLAESPLKVTPMTPNPSTMRFISFMISLCFDVVWPRYTMKAWKVLEKAKNSLNVLSSSFWFTSSFSASKTLSTFRHLKTCLPFFPY